VYFGLLRSAKHVHQTHRTHVFDVLKQNGFDHVNFIHTWKTKDDEQKVWDKTIQIKQSYEDIFLFNPHQHTIDDQERFLQSIDFDKYFYKNVFNSVGQHQKGEWVPGLIRNHLCALESQKRALAMVKASGIHFDFVMFIRPDVMIETPFPVRELAKLKTAKHGILIPKGSSYEGLNDRFAVTTYKNAHHYGARIDGISDFRARHGRIVSEKYVAYVVRQFYKLFPIDFNFRIVRPK
tara:strand:- start:254 stop:961 length:708 start_codon:yes stop_codon:yes gene_type:complete